MRRTTAVLLATIGATAGLAAGIAPTSLSARAQTTASRAPIITVGDASARPWLRYGDWPKRNSDGFSSLAVAASPPVPAAPRKIVTPIAGDPALGQKLAADRTRGGSCLACHVMGPAGNADLPGNVGPDLSQIAKAG